MKRFKLLFLYLTVLSLLALPLSPCLAASGEDDSSKKAVPAEPFLSESQVLDSQASSDNSIQRAPTGIAATFEVPGSYATIQAAIDAAISGDSIVVASGTYAEAITIDGKNLTITGAGSGLSVITGTTSVTTHIVYITGSATVDFSGFTVDGTGKDIQYGVYADSGTDGDIHDNEIKNVAYPNAAGLAVRREDSQIDVTDNNIYGFGRIGIYTRDDVIGNTDTGVISGNTVTGLAGLDPARLSYGISVYSGNPTVENNHIYDCLSGADVDQWTSSGMDLWKLCTPAVTNNDIHNCGNGILILNSSPTLSGNTFFDIESHNVRLEFMVKGNPNPSEYEYYDTIQDAIDAVPDSPSYYVLVWIGVYSGGGTYAEALNVNKPCHIWGHSRSTVLLDVEGHAVNGAGVYIDSNDVLISGFTLEGNSAVSTPRYGVKFGQRADCYLDDAEIRNCYRAGMDALGATNISVSDVNAHDNGGNGLQLCDCSNVTFENITTSNNSWGGVGIFTYGHYSPIGVTGVVFTGTNSFGESADDVGAIYLEEGNYNDPANPHPITYSTDISDSADVTLQLADVTHSLTGNSDNDNNYTRFYATLTDAQAAAAGTVSHILDGRYITELAGTDIYVPANLGGVAPAVVAANSGDVVHVAAGTYEEQVEISKDLTLAGAGTSTVILSPDNLSTYFTTSNDNYPIVYVHDADNVTIQDLVVDGAGKGNANYKFVGIAYRNAGGTVDNCLLKDIKDTPFSGAQHGVALYCYNTDGSGRTVNVTGNEFIGFQKNAMALNTDSTTPLTVDVSGNTVTGAGETDVTAQNGIQVWSEQGTGTVQNNTISGIGYDNTESSTKYVASSILTYYTSLDIADNTVTGAQTGIYDYAASSLNISGNEFSILNIGNGGCYGMMIYDPLEAPPSPYEPVEDTGDGMLRAPMGTHSMSVTGNKVAFNGTDNTYCYGILAYAGLLPNDLEMVVNNNEVTDFEIGIGFVSTDPTTGIFTGAEAKYNLLSGNNYGMYSNADYMTVDAEMNWWGDPSGPIHPANPSAYGDSVTDYIDYDPWMGQENAVSVVPDYGTTNCTDPISYTFHIDQAGTGEEVRGYNVTFSVDNAVVDVTAPSSDITEEDYLSSVGSTQFYVTDEGSGSYTISCAILGGDTGAAGSGDLFTVVLAPVSEGTSDISITDIALRDLDNNDLPIDGMDGSVRIDCTVPTMEAIAEAENGWYNTTPVFSNFGFDDDINLDQAQYQIDAGGWNTLFSGIDAAEWNDDGWTLPGFAGLSEGSHTVYFRVVDDAGNWNGEGTPDTYSWQFNKDTTPPDPPTGFAAEPGNNKVHLTWTNPTGDATFDGVELRRVAWGDYPEYITAPDYPADETEGAFIVQTSAEAYDNSVTAGRDIYYYTGFSYDLAGNYSSFDADAADRATSYWLGDVDTPYNGEVDYSDLVVFSSTFGVSESGSGWNNECDFGPTDDYSSYGIPLPDNVVDFEDLMIFAMIYGKVDALGATMLAAGKEEQEDLRKLVDFELTPATDADAGEGYYVVSLRLKNDAESMKGFRLSLATEGNEIISIDRGGIFKNSRNLFFGTTEGSNGTEICVAALGVNLPLSSSGEIARITLKSAGDLPSLKIREIEIRDLRNEGEKITVEEDYHPPFTPKTNALLQNYPNPFNPQTTITFDIVNAERVNIDVFNVNGRIVRNLLNERRSGGRHSIQWNGRDNSGSTVPSGIYFYRITAGNFNATRKMILLR